MEDEAGHPDGHEMSPAAIGRALGVLRREWGHLYLIGYDETRGWWAARHDQIGAYVNAGDPGALRQAIADDHGPVRSLEPVS